MRMPAYAKGLLEARGRGEQFWLAVVAIGWLRDGDVLRGRPGIARIGCAQDCDPTRMDWRALVGMDVLVTNWLPDWPKNPFAPPPLFWRSAVEKIWSARPATVWQEIPGRKARRLMRMDFMRRDLYPFVSWGAPAALDLTFQERVAHAREAALVTGEAPLFDSAEFDGPRAAAMQRWAA